MVYDSLKIISGQKKWKNAPADPHPQFWSNGSSSKKNPWAIEPTSWKRRWRAVSCVSPPDEIYQSANLYRSSQCWDCIVLTPSETLLKFHTYKFNNTTYSQPSSTLYSFSKENLSKIWLSFLTLFDMMVFNTNPIVNQPQDTQNCHKTLLIQ